VAEDLIGGLSKSRLLVVCSRHSSLSIDPQRGAQQICTQLDVDYIVQGSVRRAGDIVRVSAALVNGVQDATIWSARYDRHISDLLVIQDQITASIIATVEPALLGHEESRSLANRPRELGHWDLMMRGRWHFWRATFPDWEKARHYYERALEVAPHDASTLSQLALCMIGEIWGGAAADPEAQAKRAYQTALDAVSIDGSDAYAHYVLGTVSTILGRFDEGAAEQHRALEINPYLAAATGELGRLALFDGQLDEAVALSDQAIAASPNDPHLFLWFRHKALASFIAGDYDTAARQAAAACARSPHQFFLHYLLSACYAASGDQVRATRALHEGQRLLPGYSEAMIGRAMPFSQTANLDRYLEALWTAGWGRLPVSEQPTFLRPSHVQAS
jgi:tetratricopeptide (TPR) repeat protein